MQAADFSPKAANTEPEALLNYGGGIALVIVSLAFYLRQNAKADDGQGDETVEQEDT